MQNQSPRPQEPSDNKTVSCELIIQSDTDGIVEYNCNVDSYLLYSAH